MKFSAGSFHEVSFTDGESNVRTIRPHGGVYETEDPHAIAAMQGLGLHERTDAQVAASRARRAPKSTKVTKPRVVEASGEATMKSGDSEPGPSGTPEV